MKKRWQLFGILVLLLFAFSAAAEGAEPARKLTLMVYMCGSNLESEYGSASADLAEMQEAGTSPQETALLVMAGGTSFWHTGYDAAKTTVVEIGMGRSRNVRTEEARDMGAPETLADFLRFGMERYPAENYALILWNHGGGPLEGVCWDELFSMDSMTLQELAEALRAAELPGKLKWIGFDACLMASAEVAAAVSPYAEYMVASQETEPANGWNYSFLKEMEPGEDGAVTGRRIIDAYFGDGKNEGAAMTLSCIDLGRITDLQRRMDPFFSQLEQQLTPESFSSLSDLRFSSVSFGDALRGSEERSYDLVDLRDLVVRYSRNNNGEAVLKALDSAVVYSRSTREGVSGLTVYHPYRNKQKYRESWKKSLEDLSFSAGMTAYLEKFGSLLTGESLAGWADLTALGEEDGEGRWTFTLQMTPEQRENCVSAQLLILGATDLENGEYGTQATSLENARKGDTVYYPVGTVAAEADGSGQYTASYASRSLYLTDAAGKPLAGPLTYTLGEDGTTCYVHMRYSDTSGREDAAKDLEVMIGGVPEEGTSRLRITTRLGWDSATKTFTERIPIREEEYTRLAFYIDGRRLPEGTGDLPGYDAWEKSPKRTGQREIRLPMQWELRFFDTQQSAAQLFAVFQVTDSQQNTHSSTILPLPNPNLEQVGITPRLSEAEEYGLRLYLLRDTSPLDPGLNLVAEITNLSRWTANYILDNILLNDTQAAVPDRYTPIYFGNMAPGETRVLSLHIAREALTGLAEVTSLGMTMDVYLHENTKHNYQQQLRFTTDRCSLEGIAPAAEIRVMAEAWQDGILWQLLSLQTNKYGDITGMLRVENHNGTPLEHSCSAAVNRYFADNVLDSLDIVIPENAAGVIPFTVSNGTVLKKLMTIRGRTGWYWLAAGDLLPRQGITEIREIELIRTQGYSVRGDVRLELAEPFRLQAGGAEAESSGGLPLMTGEIEVAAERALAADDGAGFRLVLRNHTDKIVFFQVYGKSLNGKALDQLPDSVVIPAQGSTSCCVAVVPEEGEAAGTAGEPVREAGLAFRVNDEWSSPEVRIAFHTEEGGSRYLSPAEMSAEPVRWSKPELSLQNPEQEIRGIFEIRAESSFDDTIYYDTDRMRFVENRGRIRLKASVKNLAEETRQVTFSEFVVNGKTVTGVSWTPIYCEPGIPEELEAEIPLDVLCGTEELREIECVFTWKKREPRAKEYSRTVRFAFEPCDLRGLVPERAPSAASGTDGLLQWELLDLAEEEDGSVELALRVRNNSGEAVDDPFAAAAVNGVYFGSFSLYLPAGTERTFTLRSRNRFTINAYMMEINMAGTGANAYDYEKGLLQRRGVRQVESVQLFTGMQTTGEEGYRRAELKPAAPLALSGVEAGGEQGAYTLLNDETFRIEARGMLAGSNGIAVSADLANNGEQPVYIRFAEGGINGISCTFGNPFDAALVPPGIRYPMDLILLLPDNRVSEVTLVREVSLRWQVGDWYWADGSFQPIREVPLGAEGGLELDGGDLAYKVDIARLLENTYVRMEAEHAARVRLIPGLSADRVARFESGNAVVYNRRQGAFRARTLETEGEDYQYLPTAGRICTAALKQEDTGVIAATFSGLAWVNSRGEALEYTEEQDPEIPGRFYVMQLMSLFRDEAAFREIPEEMSLEHSATDYFYLTSYMISMPEDVPVPEGFLFLAYTPDGADATEAFRKDRIAVSAGEQQVLYLRGDEPVLEKFEKRTVINQNDLKWIPVEDLGGELCVLYEIRYTDGTTETFFEEWPE